MENETLIGVQQKIKKIREIKGFSQEYVAAKLKITQNTYSKIERGENILSVDKLNAICKILEVDFNTLLNFDEKQVFNNCTQTGNFVSTNTFVINTIEKIQELYDKIIKAKEDEIEYLKENIKELKKK